MTLEEEHRETLDEEVNKARLEVKRNPDLPLKALTRGISSITRTAIEIDRHNYGNQAPAQDYASRVVRELGADVMGKY